MAEAQKLADEGDVVRANTCLAAARAHVTTSMSCQTAYTQQLTADLMTAEAATVSRSRWEAEGQKRVSAMKSSHAMQRSNRVEASEHQAMYATSAKSALRSKAR